MKLDKKIERVKKLSDELNLINSYDFAQKYFGKGKANVAHYHFNKANIITIGGTKFIIDYDPIK